MVWLRAIRAASVTMLRSRGARLGRFHRSPSSVPCAYFARAGATVRTSSSVSMELLLGIVCVVLACPDAEATRESAASAAARRLMSNSRRSGRSPLSDGDDGRGRGDRSLGRQVQLAFRASALDVAVGVGCL